MGTVHEVGSFTATTRAQLDETFRHVPETLTPEDLATISVEDIRVKGVYEKVEENIRAALEKFHAEKAALAGGGASPPSQQEPALPAPAAPAGSPGQSPLPAVAASGSAGGPSSSLASGAAWRRQIRRNNFLPAASIASGSAGPSGLASGAGTAGAEPDGPDVTPHDVMITVEFHNKIKTGSAKAKFQEFRMLGRQTLCSLRDKLYCIHDHILSGPNTPSGYFLIGNVFYSDMRKPGSIDYSKELIPWVAKGSKAVDYGLDKATMRKMEDTHLSDLVIELNQHYLYVHQGNCTHSIVFTDMRLPHPDDPLPVVNYPLLTFQGRIYRRGCRACLANTTKFVTFYDRLAEESPCFYCESCYFALHYDTNGKLLYDDYQVYPYYHE